MLDPLASETRPYYSGLLSLHPAKQVKFVQTPNPRSSSAAFFSAPLEAARIFAHKVAAVRPPSWRKVRPSTSKDQYEIQVGAEGPRGVQVKHASA